MFNHQYFSAQFFNSVFFSPDESTPQLLASLGAAPVSERRRKRPDEEREDEQIADAIPPAMVSRLRDEMLSATMAADVVERAQDMARKAKRRKDAAILLLMSV